MSRKHGKQKTGFPWLPVAIGGGLLIVAAFFLANQGGDGGGTPALTVDQQLIDFGDVKFDVEKTLAIKVTNTGNGTLRFKEKPYIEVLEGC